MIEKTIEELLCYARFHLYLDDNDVTFKRNELLHEFNKEEPECDPDIDIEAIRSLTTPTSLINELKSDIPTITEEEIERVMSIITPLPSTTKDTYYSLRNESSRKANLYLYNLMISNNYIKLDDIKKNVYWRFLEDNNSLEITINLSKPEKDNKDIAKLKTLVSTGYPKCNLCYENEGYYGGVGKNPRSNIRVIPIKLGGENWFMQYSPYSYYEEHAIIINKLHTPMAVSKRTIEKELEFIEAVPDYFVGSNSDLPIVGGSILNHEHFQGGLHIMPMMNARTRYRLSRKGIMKTEISYLDWYNSCFLLKSTDKAELINIADFIIQVWRNYDDEAVDLISNDQDGNHSTVTPISRKVGDTYYTYIILRNNRCNDKYKDGIFHAHPEYHNIKKEGIGLIEAMGLFILPGRLQKELSLISDIMSNSNYSVRETIINNPSLEKHLDFINGLVVKYGRTNNKEVADEIIKMEVGKVCKNILLNTGIYKDTIDGQLGLFRLFKRLSFEVLENE